MNCESTRPRPLLPCKCLQKRALMDKLTENAVQFLDVLRMAGGHEVSQWNSETLSSAFGWAVFFENVHERLKTKPTSAESFDRRFRRLGREMGFDIGYDYLRNATRHLEQLLLRNEKLNDELFARLLEDYGSRGKSRDFDAFRRDSVENKRSEAKLRLIKRAHSIFDDGIRSTSKKIKLADDVIRCVDSKALKEKIDNIGNRTKIDDLLDREEKNLNLNVILETALITENDELSRNLILDWVYRRCVQCSTLWQTCNPGLLSRCASFHEDLLSAYLGFLIRNLNRFLQQRLWKKETCDESVALTSFSARIEILSRASQGTKKACVVAVETARKDWEKRCKGKNEKETKKIFWEFWTDLCTTIE